VREAHAQEDSRLKSENIKWGLKHSIEARLQNYIHVNVLAINMTPTSQIN